VIEMALRSGRGLELTMACQGFGVNENEDVGEGAFPSDVLALRYRY
jgi:hypothetical protein